MASRRPGSWNPEGGVSHPEDARRIRRDRLSDDNGLITMGLGTRGAMWLPYEQNNLDVKLGMELDVIVSEHSVPGANNAYNHEDIPRRGREGLLNEKINFVHCNALSEGELKVLAEYGCSVSVTSQAEMHMGFGRSAITPCLVAGIRPTLGTDVASSYNPDMFTEMRVALQWQRSLDGQIVREQTGDIPSEIQLKAKDVVHFATIDGAKALGLDSRIGSLAPGKEADIILIRTDDINMSTCNDPYQMVALFATASNVDTVMVQGKILKQGGKLVDSGVAEKLSQLETSTRRILEAAAIK